METKKYVEARASIASPEDLKIYDEIVEACNHNLLRAAYILAWVAIVESLKRKIYRLADDGDARSKILKEKIEENEKNSNSSDKCIFEGVTDADIVPKKYKSDLAYLWQKRCLYAHPYLHTPDEQDVCWILDKALEITLTQDLLYTGDMVDKFIGDELDTFHTIPTLKEEQADYIKRHLNLIKHEHYPKLFQKLFYHTRLCMDSHQGAKLGYMLRFVKLFVEEKSPQLNEKPYRLKDGVAKYPNTMWYVAAIPAVWNVLDTVHKDGLFRYLSACTQDEECYGLNAVRHLLLEGVQLNDEQKSIYYNRILCQPISSCWQLYVDKSKLVDRIDQEWVSTYNWDKQARFVSLLKDSEGSIETFDSASIENLGRLLASCCNANAYVAHNLVSSKDTRWFTQKLFRVGFAANLFIVNDKFYFSNNYAIAALEFCTSLDQDDQEEVFNKLQHVKYSADNIFEATQNKLRKRLAEIGNQMCANLKQLFEERIEGCFQKLDYNNNLQ